jgi:hypothetical protein
MIRGKVQTENIVIANGTVAGRYETRVTLDSEYDFCTGYYAIENINGGLTRYNLGLKDDNKTYSDLVNSQSFQTDRNIEITKRYNPDTPFKSKGITVTVTVEFFQALTADLNIDMLFRLKKEENC